MFIMSLRAEYKLNVLQAHFCILLTVEILTAKYKQNILRYIFYLNMLNKSFITRTITKFTQRLWDFCAKNYLESVKNQRKLMCCLLIFHIL